MNRIGKILLLSGLALLLWGDSPAGCGQDPSVPAGKDESTNIGGWLVSIFRDHISAVDGDRCPSVPSCASYGVQAFKKHGFFMGWMMTVDRLIHEADEGSFSPLVYHDGRLKALDPVESNDFWWSRRNGKSQD